MLYVYKHRSVPCLVYMDGCGEDFLLVLPPVTKKKKDPGGFLKV